MALKSNYNEGRFSREVKKQVDVINEQIINSFITAGEQFITDAREQGQSHAAGQYEDVTANLRNSIGYYIFHNGEKVIGKEPGSLVGKTSEGKLSASDIALINETAIKDMINPKGFQLIGVAGMNYASHVESKGYNVISYQADVCLVNLAEYLEKLNVIEKGSAARMEETFIP